MATVLSLSANYTKSSLIKTLFAPQKFMQIVSKHSLFQPSN